MLAPLLAAGRVAPALRWGVTLIFPTELLTGTDVSPLVWLTEVILGGQDSRIYAVNCDNCLHAN